MIEKNNKPFSEVIESSLEEITAQCWDWDSFPTFGSLVEVNSSNIKIFGCVSSINTGSLDSNRYPFPYKKTEEELKADHPHIFEFLKTLFKIKVLGYMEENRIYYMLPPSPAKIHSFVNSSSEEFSKTFFSKSDFLYPLFSGGFGINQTDDILLAIFRNMSKSKFLTPEKMNDICQTLSLITGNDYRKIKLFLKRTKSLL